MKAPIKPRQVPPRIIAGAFILDQGLGKRSADEETAKKLHGMAANAYPFLADIDPQRFVSMLSSAEIAIGLALVVPVVPTRWAALALAGFSGGLLGLYLRTPGMTQEGSLAPTKEGLPLAKDSWLFAIALGLLVDTLDD